MGYISYLQLSESQPITHCLRVGVVANVLQQLKRTADFYRPFAKNKNTRKASEKLENQSLIHIVKSTCFTNKVIVYWFKFGRELSPICWNSLGSWFCKKTKILLTTTSATPKNTQNNLVKSLDMSSCQNFFQDCFSIYLQFLLSKMINILLLNVCSVHVVDIDHIIR